MNKTLFGTAFFLGAAAVVWMCWIFAGTHGLAFFVTALIGVGFVIGAQELRLYRQATASLSIALDRLPPEVDDLQSWIGRLHNSLRNTVQLRIEGERVALPSPVLTPYLVGLLVMLGLLGTFMGMVETLEGAVFALEGTTELTAVREGLAAPIKGLGLAFGTSVAGVAASAMLGLMSTLSRRERMLATQSLDSSISSVFRRFSLVYNRQQTFKAMQLQAEALPLVADKLSDMADKLEQMNSSLVDKLLDGQQNFQAHVGESYTQLASDVRDALKDSLAESARLSAESINPVVEKLMSELQGKLEANAQTTHEQLTANTSAQLQSLSEQLVGSTKENTNALQANLAEQQQALVSQLENTAVAIAEQSKNSLDTQSAKLAELLQASETLVQTRINTEEQWVAGHKARMDELTSTIQAELAQLGELEAERSESGNQRIENLATTMESKLEALAHQESERSTAAINRLQALEGTVAEQLATLGNALEAPMSSLIETASEAPRAAAEVIVQLRAEIANTTERENAMLEERQAIMEQLASLTSAMAETTAGQQQAMETLVSNSAELLDKAGSRFNEQVDSETNKLNEMTSLFAGSAAEMASLGEAFSHAVELFNQSNEQLVLQLTRIEESLKKSTERNDEQLAYYVTQAREIIDHSVLRQQQVMDAMSQPDLLEENAEPAAETEMEEA